LELHAHQRGSQRAREFGTTGDPIARSDARAVGRVIGALCASAGLSSTRPAPTLRGVRFVLLSLPFPLRPASLYSRADATASCAQSAKHRDTQTDDHAKTELRLVMGPGDHISQANRPAKTAVAFRRAQRRTGPVARRSPAHDAEVLRRASATDRAPPRPAAGSRPSEASPGLLAVVSGAPPRKGREPAWSCMPISVGRKEPESSARPDIQSRDQTLGRWGA
jgi:hypothetical protein